MVKYGKNTKHLGCDKKKKISIKFHSEPIYEQNYLKAKVRESDGVIKTTVLGNDTPKENMHYTCIACITTDSVMRIDKKNNPQTYLEEYEYKIKKIQISRFINTDSDSFSKLDSETESKFDIELLAKLESNYDSE